MWHDDRGRINGASGGNWERQASGRWPVPRKPRSARLRKRSASWSSGISGRTVAPLDSPLAVKNYLALKLTDQECECFCAIWLDADLRPNAFEEISRGTLFTANVYVREVVKSALATTPRQ